MERVQKLLSNYGHCSRRKAEELIKTGRVTVNGKQVSLGDLAGEADDIAVDGKKIRQPRKIYILFHKPKGCVTAVQDNKYRTVMNFIRIKERIFPVGRLDYNTTGALILTNDGDFANLILHPRYEVNRTYLTEIDRPLTYAAVHEIERGVELEDGKTSPARVRLLRPTLVEITLHEGKNHIVKRILQHFGLRVLALSRIKIGKLSLGSLRPGRFRHLTQKDKELILGKKNAPAGIRTRVPAFL